MKDSCNWSTLYVGSYEYSCQISYALEDDGAVDNCTSYLKVTIICRYIFLRFLIVKHTLRVLIFAI